MKHTHRGTCQVCGSTQAQTNHGLATHGYTVTYGFFNGICHGTNAAPLELDKQIAEKTITWLKETIIPASKKHIADLRSGAVQPNWVKQGKLVRGVFESIPCTRAELSDYEAKAILDRAIRKQEHNISGALAHSKMLTGLIATRHGQPLYAVTPEPARKTIEAGDTILISKTPFEVIAVRSQRVTGCGPYLNGHHLPHAVVMSAKGTEFATPIRLIRQASIIKK